MSEKDCKYVCSRGILGSCDVKSMVPVSSIHQLYQYDWSKLTPGCSIYVCNLAIPHFVKIFPEIKYPFVLVSGDCDECCPYEIFVTEYNFTTFIESPKIIHWFSQNLVIEHPKMTQLPIGLDYHTMTISPMWGKQISPIEQETQLIHIRENALPWNARKCMIYSNFHFSTSTKFAKDRLNAIAEIPKELIFYEPIQVERAKSWENQCEYTFVASPHGGGLDCHRTWEALCLGCIVIVKTSPLDKMYEGLPVWIVSDWANITQELLEYIIETFQEKTFQYEKLTMKYWMDLIVNMGLCNQA
jgi:hypothetical protein